MILITYYPVSSKANSACAFKSKIRHQINLIKVKAISSVCSHSVKYGGAEEKSHAHQNKEFCALIINCAIKYA